MSEHSKTPWRTDMTRTLVLGGDRAVADTYGSSIKTKDTPTSQANAELIVKAVNAYTSDQQLIKDLVDGLEEIASRQGKSAHDMNRVQEQAKALIARAEK